MITIFQLWTFHLYVATFQQYLHMEYISISWSDIPELVVSVRISWKRVAANRETTEPRVPIGQVEVITSKDLRSTPMTMTWLTVTEYLCHKWPSISFTCRKHSPSSFLIHHKVFNYSSTTGATSRERTPYPSGVTEFTPVFYVLLFRLLFVRFL
jgi:hypothetical protein